MTAFLNVILRLLSFRAGGADLPYAPRLLVVLVVAMVGCDIWLSHHLEGSDAAPQWILLRTLIGIGLIFLVLRAADKPARFVQTATALTLVAFAITILSAPILLAIWPLPEDPKQITGTQAALVMPLLAVMLWFLILRAHVLRGALECLWFAAFMLSLLLLFVESAVTLSLMNLFK